MYKRLPEEESSIESVDKNKGNHYSKELQKLLTKQPELQQWRDECIEGQKKQGMYYSDFATSETLSSYLERMPHTVEGWSILAFSPRDSLLHVKKLSREEIFDGFVIDPFRLPHILLSKVKSQQDMDKLIEIERGWLKRARSVSSGKVVIGCDDGQVRMFQGRRMGVKGRGNKLQPLNEAELVKCSDIFSAADACQHAIVGLREDQQTIQKAIQEHAGSLRRILDLKTNTAFTNSLEGIVKKIHTVLADVKNVFEIEKMLTDYLLKLNNGLYDEARIIQALRWLSRGHLDRAGKANSIENLQAHILAYTHSHRLEWQKLFIVNETDGRIDVVTSLANIAENSDRFAHQIKTYIGSETSHIPEPFYGFRESWKKVSQKTEDISGETPEQNMAQLLLKQFSYVLFSTIKTEYGYNRRDWKIPQKTQIRIENIRKIWQGYGNQEELPEIRYDLQKNFMADLKKMIECVR